MPLHKRIKPSRSLTRAHLAITLEQIGWRKYRDGLWVDVGGVEAVGGLGWYATHVSCLLGSLEVV